jgi:N-acetylglucosaminyldiphosphoundecaprenol N-acetyl-beta-D-mannosaminyltransferase
MMSGERPAQWPAKRDLFGVGISATTYREAAHCILRAAMERRSACVSALAVHGLMSGARDAELASLLNRFDMLTPDGQPVRLALNLLHGAGLDDRVYGPELMLHVCEQAARARVSIYLYGSEPRIVARLAHTLHGRYPALRIAGCEPSLFRRLSETEDRCLIGRINTSGAGILFLGLGCPLQERFADEHRATLQCVQICVGAAFAFHAGAQPMAPRWMQRHALEWLFRLTHEPRRLWKRYAVTNTAFLLRLAAEWRATRVQTHASVAPALDEPQGGRS